MPFATNLDFPVFITTGTEIHLNYGLITVAVAEYLTTACALICAICLYRLPIKVTNPKPVVSILIIGMTALTTGLQFFFPEFLSEFRRNLAALRAGEWWRLVTPLFVQAYGWGQCVGNGIAAFFLLPLAEKFYRKKLFALYIGPGILGEIFFYTLEPNTTGAGSSLAIYGVLGGLFVFVCRDRHIFPPSMTVFAVAGLCSGIVESFFHDFHGTSMLAGALLASMMSPRLQTIPKRPPKQK